MADKLHARADGLTSLAVVLGAAGVSLGWSWADPAGGLGHHVRWAGRGLHADVVLDVEDGATLTEVHDTTDRLTRLSWVRPRIRRASLEPVRLLEHDGRRLAGTGAAHMP